MAPKFSHGASDFTAKRSQFAGSYPCPYVLEEVYVNKGVFASQHCSTSMWPAYVVQVVMKVGALGRSVWSDKPVSCTKALHSEH